MLIGLWLFLNVLVALSPLAVIAGALAYQSKKITLSGLAGDGFLFFFSVILAAGLISDVSKELLAPTPRISIEAAVSLIIGGVVVIGTTLICYFAALSRRVSGQTEGGTLHRWSLLFAAVALILTIFVRWKMHLW